MRHIAFLFNHDQPHQVAHSLPIALDLIKRGAAKVSLVVTNQSIGRTVREMAGPLLAKAHLVALEPESSLSKIAVSLLDGLLPARKLSIYRDHLELFKSFDALVVSEKSSLVLKTRYGLETLKLVHTRHGAGDRAIGFNRESGMFDLVLVSGTKIRDRLVSDAGVAPAKIAIIGYSKFDQYETVGNTAKLFANTRPTILYNPHPSPRLSSWYKWGEAVLDYFANQEKYNLIFAPHVMLFQRKWTFSLDPLAVGRARKPGQQLAELPHIHIDLGSPASIDMSYTRAADLYLGDVSSQVYEFMARPRPCAFLNPHMVKWRRDPSYKHWHAGPVIDTLSELPNGIDAAFMHFPHYKPLQHSLLEETFSVTDQPAAQRGAAAILDLFK